MVYAYVAVGDKYASFGSWPFTFEPISGEGRMRYILVFRLDWDELVVSIHKTRETAEKALQKKQPFGTLSSKYRVVDDTHYEVIEVFGKKMVRQRS